MSHYAGGSGKEYDQGVQDGDKALHVDHFAAIFTEEALLPQFKLSGFCRSELEGTDDEEYPDNQGIDPDQPHQS
jgi:hypothetical protein